MASVLTNWTQQLRTIRWEGGDASRTAVTAALAPYAQVLFDSTICFIVPRGNPDDHVLVRINQVIVLVPKFGVYENEAAFLNAYPGAVKQ